jgi:hypothetical protein
MAAGKLRIRRVPRWCVVEASQRAAALKTDGAEAINLGMCTDFGFAGVHLAVLHMYGGMLGLQYHCLSDHRGRCGAAVGRGCTASTGSTARCARKAWCQPRTT